MDPIFKFYPEFAKSKSLTVPIIPGNCSFHNDVTIYAADANMTNGFWCAMACAYIPDGEILNGIQDILSDKQIHKLNIDNFPQDDRLNSPIFSKAPILS